MNDHQASTLAALARDLQEGTLSRRRFMTGAAQLGISASLAAAIFQAHKSGSLAAPALSLQDDGKTLVVAIAQATVQLDPAIAGRTAMATSSRSTRTSTRG